MPDYDFSRLDPRSFEQLVQTLSTKVLGPGLVVFGDGPDGGREASFEGSVDYPSSAHRWSGYTVIQAKFRQRPQSSSKSDASWLLEQLNHEMKKFADPKRQLRPPKYYILATNAILTPVAKRGGKDIIDKALKKHCKDLEIADFRVWDRDQLRTFLDSAEDVRRAYAAWITPGDVLSEVLKWVAGETVNFHQVMANFLQKELLANQYARLHQAGVTLGERTSLAKIFVDLPAGLEPAATPAPTSEGDGKRPLGIVMQLLEAGNQKLDSRSILPTEDLGPAGAKRPAGRYVLIGGPGQGKTTVSQFTAQLYRAALLEGRKELTGDAKTALKDILDQCAEENLSLPSARRFPLVVVLNDFAKALASDKGPKSLLSYLVDRVKQRTDQNVSANEFRKWLASYSFVLTLDGLDEVPASSNRHDVLSALQDFRVDIAEINADVLILATTRPQGYNEDFDPKLFSHVWLEPLSSGTALHYAKRLTDNQYGADDEGKNKVLGRLHRAIEEEATRRLMQSPLQVTIMATLVDQGGEPPQERWNLFYRYYDVIYKREMERDIPAAAILRGYQPDVDAIHQRVGLVLQIESERTGGTDARLPVARLSEIIDERLRTEAHQGDDLERLKKSILEAATQRLVFLVSPQEGQVGFEIRSLQEFMAGQAIMEGADQVGQDRLKAIARYAHWRNVFLFAAGHSFFKRQWLRDTIVAICKALNDDPDDELARVTLSGSRLAMDLLEEGSARRQPGFATVLARVALRILERPVDSMHRRLALAYDPLLETVFRDEISPRLSDADPDRAHPAWAALVGLADAGVEWAKHDAERFWPKEPARAADLAQILLQHQEGRPGWVRKHFNAFIAHLGPVAGMYWTGHPYYRRPRASRPIRMRVQDDLDYISSMDPFPTLNFSISICTRDARKTNASISTNSVFPP